ncbi:hypothetical protein C0V70_17155 [Bacteriovorax stolpii]|uniref:ComEC/Rec2-related protein domain-containing protein n=1 Tax=Bacteriovorax stolpii TaxID=960 RepID=A0A2K9NWB4_BACTC|nr:ComEC/Rec2 family competence protein [Bacteriovorax stolpii]AUN99801.1 hypothetical protein C0V70_17155 [Bacteriovorax stolpii]TDP54309.1 competence protein [Bacteriovorax stolpii]
MKFFVLFSLILALSLGVTMERGVAQKSPPPRTTPPFLQKYQRSMKADFKKPENANLLFSFITGNKNGISPYTRKAFKKTNLSHLLAPSGIHYASVLFLLFFLVKKMKAKRWQRIIKVMTYSSAFFLPGFTSIHRLSILRLLLQFKFLAKRKWSIEVIFFLTFAVSFLCGHYSDSPLGFLMSFAFLGTFFAFQNHSKIMLILGLFSTQLILGLFMGEKVSLLSIPVGLVGSALFALLFPTLLLFLASYWLIPFNWGEPLIRSYVVSVQVMAKMLQGSFTSSSVFLILAVWALLILKTSKRKYAIVFLLIFLHTNTAMTPVIFSHLS